MYHRSMSQQVVALGAWCDLVPEEEVRATPGGAHIRVHEFAILADGRRVTIRDDLGFSSWSRTYSSETGETRKVDPWRSITRESVEHEVRNNVVVPDDFEYTDEHPYGWLRELLLRQGIETTEEQLRAVPYTVELSDRLERRLSEESSSDGM